MYSQHSIKIFSIIADYLITNAVNPLRCHFVVLLTFLPCFLFAQKMTDTLKEINVHEHKQTSNDLRVNDFSPGQKIKPIDSISLQQYQLQNLANLLSQQTSVFIKSYGFNELATLNFRGSSAAQSTVLWNGVPLQNPALGIADVSELPVFLINRINVVYGSSSAMWGSGNVGGAVLLENDNTVFDSGKKTLSLSGGTGNFGQYTGGVTGSIASKRWYFSLGALAQTALNNFPYTTLSGVHADMTNSLLQSTDVLTRIAYKINERNIISLSSWYQQYNREIPSALFETFSDKKQTDGSLRLLLDWNRQAERSLWYAKASLIRDYIHYTDSAVLLDTKNTAYQYYQEIGWKKNIFTNGQLILFSPIQLSWLNLQSGVTKRQLKIALAGAYNIKFFQNKLNVAINARGEIIDSTSVFLPGADASYTIFQWLNIRANVQRTYRAPTLNELYYFPGGNSELKPEQGWNEDAGYTIKIKKGNLSFYHDLSLFNRDIQNWIVWLGGAIWTPHNIANVNSRGIETENNIEWTLGDWTIHLGVNTSYVLATTESSYIPNDGSIGKQIPYTPRYNGQLNAGFRYKKFHFNYNHTYTGYRFITSDESEYLLPYQTGNAQLMYNSTIHKHSLQLTAQCNNIWNEQYEVAAYRPLPGVNWLAGFKIGIME